MKKKSVIKLPFPELLFPYSPVAKPMPPLTITEVCQAPRVQVEFSCELVPYLLGLLEIYRYKDSFTGTDEQKTISVGVMRQLMEELAMAGCGCDDDKVIIRRINPETGQVEISEDDGATWTTDPQSPYVQATIAIPLTGPDGDVKRCEAANNVVEHLQDIQAEFSLKIGLINNVADMIVAIIVIALGILFLPFVGAALLAVITPLFTKLFEVARYLSNTTQGQYDALFTNEVWTLTRCILYCHVSDNGSFSQSAWSSVQSDMKAQMGSGIQEAGANLAAIVDVWGLVGLNNAARIGSGAEGNCDDCDCDDVWCYNFDFASDDGDWLLDTTLGDNNGTYQAGTGWAFSDYVNVDQNPDTANRAVAIDRNFNTTSLTKITVTYNYVGGQYDTNTLRALIIYINAVDVAHVLKVDMIDGNDQIFVWEGELGERDQVGLFLRSSRDPSVPHGYSGNCLITSIQLEGTGTNPFGGDNCP